MKKMLMIIMDGLPDGKETGTTLQSANIPNLNFLAKNGYAGLVENRLDPHPESGISNFYLLGYTSDEYPGRGYLEALGIGIKPKTDELCLRANFCTVKEMIGEKAQGEFGPKMIMVDRRAGRDKTELRELAAKIAQINIDGMKVKFFKSVGHRGVVTINSVNASMNITPSDPHEINVEIPEIRPTSNDNKAAETAATLNKWSHEVYKILKDDPSNKLRKMPANFVVVRGPGIYKFVKSMKDKYGLDAGLVAGSPILKGIGRALDMEVPDLSTATADYNTDLKDKTLKALDMLASKDLVVLHIKATDIAGHDKNKKEKKRMIEKIDREVFGKILEYVNFAKTAVAVIADHPTSLETGNHEAGFIPFIFSTDGIEKTHVKAFDELSCKDGPVIDIDEFMEEFMALR